MARLVCPDLFPRLGKLTEDGEVFVCPQSVGRNPGMSLRNAMFCYWKVKKWGISYSGSFSSGELLSGYQEVDVGIRKVRDQSTWPYFLEQGQRPTKVDQLVCYPGKSKILPEPSFYVLNFLTNKFEPQPIPEWGPFFQESGVFDDSTPYTIRTYDNNDFVFRDQTEAPIPFCRLEVESLFSGGSIRHRGAYFNGPQVFFSTSGGVGVVTNLAGNADLAGRVSGGTITIMSGSETLGQASLYNAQADPIGTLNLIITALELWDYSD